MPSRSDPLGDYLGSVGIGSPSARSRDAGPSPAPRRPTRQTTTPLDDYLAQMLTAPDPPAPAPRGIALLPRLVTEGVPAAGRAAVDAFSQPSPRYAQIRRGLVSEPVFGGPPRSPTFRERLEALSPPSVGLGLLDVVRRATDAFGAGVAELGPEQAKPLTRAFAENLPFLGPGGFRRPRPIPRTPEAPSPQRALPPGVYEAPGETLMQRFARISAENRRAIEERIARGRAVRGEPKRPYEAPPTIVPGRVLEGEVLDQYGRPIRAPAPTMDPHRGTAPMSGRERQQVFGRTPFVARLARTSESTPTAPWSFVDRRLESAAAEAGTPSPDPHRGTALMPTTRPRAETPHAGTEISPGTVDLGDPDQAAALVRGYGGINFGALTGEGKAVPWFLRNQKGAPLDEIVQEIADAQSRRPKDVERQLLGTLGRYHTLRQAARAERAGGPSGRIPTQEEYERMTVDQSLDEYGRARSGLLARLGSSAGGAAVGGTQGDSPSERLRNAAIGAALGLAGPELYRFARGAGDVGGISSRGQMLRRRVAAEREAAAATQQERPVTPATGPRLGASGVRATEAPVTPETANRVTAAARGAVEPGVREPATVTPRPTTTWLGLVDSIQSTFAPATRGPHAQQMAGVLRPRLAELARKTEIAHAELRRAERFMETLPEPVRYGMIDALEAGQIPSLPADQLTVAQTLRRVLDERRGDVQNLGTGKLEHFIENYFPHIWKDPERAANALAAAYARRPLAGPGSFLKQRVIPTVAEGRALGLEPVTSNPVTLTLLKLREMDRYVMGQSVLQDLRDGGLVRLVPYDARPPVGWERINDTLARAGRAGQHWAPEPAARVLNNHLSPGLSGHALYDAFRGLGNVLNQAQLGLSAFHLGFVSVDTMVSKAALGIQQLVAGRPLQAARSLLSAPAAPFTTFIKGNRVLREYFAPGSGGQEMAAVIDNLITAGGRARMDRFYGGGAMDQFFLALKGGRYGSATLRAFPALLDAVSRPVMEEFVPRVKLGVFADLAEFELSKLPAGAPRAEVVRVLGRAWDSVDNRLGQLVYDNVFWNRALKDGLMASVRSVGWNLGTFRELVGGGGGDPFRMVTGRAPLELTPRMAYTMALPFVVGLYGSIYQYLATGRGPETLRDAFYPRTGRTRPDGSDDRVSLPSYMKDVVAYAQHPWTTIKHKVNPTVSLLSEMLENEDFYGALIRNPDDPTVMQMYDLVKHAAVGFESFSFRGFKQQLATGATPGQAAQGFIGITPAPASITREGEVQRAKERAWNRQKLRRKQREERGDEVRPWLEQSLR